MTRTIRALAGGAALALFSAVSPMPAIAQARGRRRHSPRRRRAARPTPPLIMTTDAWEDGGVIPNKYTMAGRHGGGVARAEMVASARRARRASCC